LKYKVSDIMNCRALMTALMPVLLLACSAPRDYVRIVGSSTLYPFVATAAEQFGRNTPFKTPVIESTGTGGGMKLFCSGLGLGTPDISNASRLIKEKERQRCAKNGVGAVLEIPLGYDGIVIANLRKGPRYSLTLRQLFLALAKHVPGENGQLTENPYQLWNEIDATLPAEKISIYGPPPTSGTRDAFVELVMHKACDAMPAFKAAYADKKERHRQCGLLREDGLFVDAGENDNIIVQKLKANERAVGIFGYSFLAQNADVMQAASIEGVSPEFARIASGEYAISRSLFVYVKAAHFDKVKSLKPFLQDMMSEASASETGTMALKGMIPMPAAQRKQNQERLSSGAL